MKKNLLKNVYGKGLLCLKKICGVDFAKKIDTRLRFKRCLDLKKPKTLADKVAYIENHLQPKQATICTDKWEVRNYVKDKGLEDILVPVYGQVYEKFEDIPFQSLPSEFVLKATHGCKMNYICRDKEKIDLEDVKKQVRLWLNTTYGAYSCEWHYLDIQHRIYCEKYLYYADGIVDYKIHCIDGEPAFILAFSNRKVTKTNVMCVEISLFDTLWNPLPGLKPYKCEIPAKEFVDKPEKLNEMLHIAKKLSEDFKFVRVDLYEHEGKVMFGELTFSPAACVFPYFTDEFLVEWGEKLRI